MIYLHVPLLHHQGVWVSIGRFIILSVHEESHAQNDQDQRPDARDRQGSADHNSRLLCGRVPHAHHLPRALGRSLASAATACRVDRLQLDHVI